MNNKFSLTLDDPPKLFEIYESENVGYTYWKKLFEIYVKSKSLGLWRITEFGDYVPRKVSTDGNSMISKPESEWSAEDEAKVSENYSAIRLLHSVVSDEDFKIIFFCNTAHDIWIALGIIHQGDYQLNQLKNSRINHYTQLFETIKVCKYDHKNDPYYVENFKHIINCLKALGKTYTNEACVERFLSALPSRWDDKVKAIRENKNLSVIPLDELIGDLEDYENTLETYRM